MTKKILSLQGLTEEIASLQEKLGKLLPVWTRLGDIEDRLTALETPQSNGEIRILEELVETYRQNQAQCNCGIEYQVKALQEKVEGLEDRQEDHGVCTHQDVEDRTARLESRSFEANKRLDHCEKRDKDATEQRIEIRGWITPLENARDLINNWGVKVDERLTALEPPNQSDCLARRVEILEENLGLAFYEEIKPNQPNCPLGHECVEGKGYWVMRPFKQTLEECGECPKKSDERAETIRRARAIVLRTNFHAAAREMTPQKEKILKALDIAEGKL